MGSAEGAGVGVGSTEGVGVDAGSGVGAGCAAWDWAGGALGGADGSGAFSPAHPASRASASPAARHKIEFFFILGPSLQKWGGSLSSASKGSAAKRLGSAALRERGYLFYFAWALAASKVRVRSYQASFFTLWAA